MKLGVTRRGNSNAQSRYVFVYLASRSKSCAMKQTSMCQQVIKDLDDYCIPRYISFTFPLLNNPPTKSHAAMYAKSNARPSARAQDPEYRRVRRVGDSRFDMVWNPSSAERHGFGHRYGEGFDMAEMSRWTGTTARRLPPQSTRQVTGVTCSPVGQMNAT